MKKFLFASLMVLTEVFAGPAVSPLACQSFYRYPSGIPRVNSFRDPKRNPSFFYTYSEVPLSKIIPLGAHPVPNTLRMALPETHVLWIPRNHIENLAYSILSKGYDLKYPAQVFLMPDGKFIGFNGHHTRVAMELLGEVSIPAMVFVWERVPETQKTLYRATYGGQFLNY